MCWHCNHPELTYDDYLDTVILPLVHQNGWAVQGVSGRHPFAYTVGLTECGVPELVITGMDDCAAATVLNAIAGRVLREDLDVGARVDLSGLALEVLAVEHPDLHLLTATALYGDEVRGLQLVWPDDRGRYPWQPGHRSRRGGQPLLGRPVRGGRS